MTDKREYEIMIPNKDTKFLPFFELHKYTDKDKYFCYSFVASPSTENHHFEGCPPYIQIMDVNCFNSYDAMFFEMPEIIAYYCDKHAGYTMAGNKRERECGKYELQCDLQKLLGIKDQ